MSRVNVGGLGDVGFNYDLPPHLLPLTAWSHARNARFTEAGVEQAGGYQIAGSLQNEATWLMQFPPLENPTWLYASGTDLYARRGEDDETQVGSGFSVSSRWQGALWNGLGILNCVGSEPQSWSYLVSGSLVQPLANWPANYRCVSIRGFGPHLVAIGIDEAGVNYPYRVFWSDKAEPGSLPDDWDISDPGSDAGNYDLAETPGKCLDQRALGKLNLIYKEESTSVMQYIGPPNIYGFFPLFEKRGLLAKDCLSEFPGGHFVVTQDDVIAHNGQKNSDTSIVKDKMRKWLFSSIDPTNYQNSYCVINMLNKEVWFCFPESGSTYATVALLWSWERGTFGIQDLDSIPFMDSGNIRSTQGDIVWG